MTSPPRQVTIACPSCAERFETWMRGSINRDLEDWTDAEIEEATTATCPSCGAVIALDALVVEGDVWTVGSESSS